MVCVVVNGGGGMAFFKVGSSVGGGMGMDVVLRSRVTTEETSERSEERRVAGIMVAVGRLLVGVMTAW